VYDVLDKTSIQIRSGNFNQISYSILIHMQGYKIIIYTKRNTESVSYSMKRILYSVSHTFSIPNNPSNKFNLQSMKANLTEIPLGGANVVT